MTSHPPAIQHGIVKQILSGDAVVIRGQPRGGPPPERTICLSNVTAPRLARRANPNLQETKDEPYAWEAREFLRKKLIGREVAFTVEYTVPGISRDYGCIYLGKDSTGENMTELLIYEGLVEVRRGGIKPNDEGQQRLVQLEEAAKSAGRGKWAGGSDHVRDIKWMIENPRHFVDSHHNKPIDAVIEHVRDGCTIRAFLLPTFEYVTVMLSGIKAPMFKLDADQQVPEPFAEEAKFYSESRLLQRDVKIILEGTSNQNFLGTVLHPNGNITELLLLEGFARCVDWSMGVVTQGAEKLRAAEKKAKEKKLRIWKDYKPSGPVIDTKDKNFQSKVVEVVNGDAMVVKTADNKFKKIFLASIRSPRLATENNENAPPNARDSNRRVRPLYDIPYMFEAREFLRKKLIGKKVNIQVDYIQPPSQGYPEKTCCTVTIASINVAEALVSKGLASVIRYRQDDDHRSAYYDDLLGAEARAQKKGVGIHSKKESPIHRVADLSGEIAKSKQFLPFLQRAGRSDAIVEFVASGSRLRLYLPRETCLITFLISGIECPKGSRPVGGTTLPADAYGEEALQFTKELCLQREVQVEVEAMDRGGNFIGWLYIDSTNLSISLVTEGLAKVFFTAERSPHYKALLDAEEKAKGKKLNIWANYEEPKDDEIIEEPLERKVNYRSVVVTEVVNELKFYAQFVDSGSQLEKTMSDLREEMESSIPGSYKPRKGDLCAAKFSEDGQWYRARVDKVTSEGKALVFYIDYGNKEETTSAMMAALPTRFHSLPAQASLFCLACVTLPDDEESKQDAVDVFYNDIFNKQLLLNAEYRGAGFDYVSLLFSDNHEDVALGLVAEGLVIVEQRKEKRLAKLLSIYSKAQDKAKSLRRNLWCYGDFTADDAKEFG